MTEELKVAACYVLTWLVVTPVMMVLGGLALFALVAVADVLLSVPATRYY